MNIPLLLYNVVFYAVIISLYNEARHDPSSSLGIGYAFVFVFLFSLAIQFILWKKKIIKVNSLPDKIGMITATPIIPITIGFVLAMSYWKNASSSIYEFNENDHRYRIIYFDHARTGKRKRIEIYKSIDKVSNENPYPISDKWMKDSTWLYFSENGDTIKKEYYSLDKLVNQDD